MYHEHTSRCDHEKVFGFSCLSQSDSKLTEDNWMKGSILLCDLRHIMVSIDIQDSVSLYHHVIKPFPCCVGLFLKGLGTFCTKQNTKSIDLHKTYTV